MRMVELIEDDGDEYEREKKVSLLILRAFKRCKLEVAESRHGVRDDNDYTGYDVLYSDDDGEAMVTIEEAELKSLVQLHGSGLIDGKCQITPTSDGQLLLTFNVNPHLRSGNAKMESLT